MNFDYKLNSIQTQLNSCLNSVYKETYNSLKINKVCILSFKGIPNTEYIAKKNWGVYSFFITPSFNILTFEDLCQLWYKDINHKIIKVPRPIKDRFTPMKAGVEYCLYVGKSQKLNYRIAQHINQTTKPSTSGLKLFNHKSLLRTCKFSFSFHSLKINPKENIDAMRLVHESTERKLRSTLKPLIGNQ